MIIDGRHIAETMKQSMLHVIARGAPLPHLAIVVTGETPVTESYVRLKHRHAESLGITLEVVRASQDITGEALVTLVRGLGQRPDIDGIIVQLPLPAHLASEAVLSAVPEEKDVDMLSRNSIARFSQGESVIVPPVALAVHEMLKHVGIAMHGCEALVLGHGRLVGVPVSILLRHLGAHVTVVDRPMRGLASLVYESRCIVTGVGQPKLITPEMIHRESILLDAGASESHGEIVGDVDPTCHEVAKWYAPVPGGLGPVAVMGLFQNALILTERRHKMNKI